MKKILIAALTGLVLQVSATEAQTREVPPKSQHVEPPPPPPPPPVPPVPPPPPVPPVPAVDEEGNGMAAITRVPQEHDLQEINGDVNEKGYALTVRTENKKAVVIVKRKGEIVKKINLKEWLANNKKYEAQYGELPPPPPPPPAPPAPPAPGSNS
jgi:hypothetical protein